jgi:hypothetical protein
MKFTRSSEDHAIVAEHDVDGHTVTFRALNMRYTSTGPHATINIFYTEPSNGQGPGKRFPLESNEFNINRMEQRVKLSNAAHDMIHNGFRDIFIKKNMRTRLKEFCDGLTNFDATDFAPMEIKGNPNYRPDFLLEPYILKGGGTILYAPGGSTKSYTAMVMAVSIHNGVSQRHGGFWDVFQTPTLYINMERSPGSMAGRLGWVNETLGLEGDTSLFMFHTRGRKLTTIKPALARFISYHEIGFTVLDSISRAGGSDLNESTTANEIMDMLNELCPSWLAIAHTPEGNSKKIFGSTHFRNAADVTVVMDSQRRGDKTGSSYQLMKGNDVGAPSREYLAFQFSDNRLEKVYRPTADEFPDLIVERDMSTDDYIIQYLRQNGNGSASQIAKAYGINRQTLNVAFKRNVKGLYVSLVGGLYGLKANERFSE